MSCTSMWSWVAVRFNMKNGSAQGTKRLRNNPTSKIVQNTGLDL